MEAAQPRTGASANATARKCLLALARLTHAKRPSGLSTPQAEGFASPTRWSRHPHLYGMQRTAPQSRPQPQGSRLHMFGVAPRPHCPQNHSDWTPLPTVCVCRSARRHVKIEEYRHAFPATRGFCEGFRPFSCHSPARRQKEQQVKNRNPG